MLKSWGGLDGDGPGEGAVVFCKEKATTCAQATATEAAKVTRGGDSESRCLSRAHPKAVCVYVCVCVGSCLRASLPPHFPMRKPVPSQVGRML